MKAVCLLTLISLTVPSQAAVDPGEAGIGAWISAQGGSFTSNAAGQIITVDLNAAWINDLDLERLRQLTHLERIDLSYTMITDRGLERLKTLQHVRDLNLYYCEYVSEAGVAHLTRWAKLEHLNLRGTKIGPGVFPPLGAIKNLRSLDIGFSDINDEGFDSLGSLTRLENLRIGGSKLSGAFLPLLKALPALTELELNGYQLTDSGLWTVGLTDLNVDHVAALTRLQKLNVGGTPVTDNGLRKLTALIQLHTLSLERTRVTSAGMALLKAFPELRRLSLWRATRIDDLAVPHLIERKKLEVLDLSDTSVSDKGLDELLKMRQLKELYVGGSAVTEEGARRFRSRNPQCYLSWWPKPALQPDEPPKKAP